MQTSVSRCITIRTKLFVNILQQPKNEFHTTCVKNLFYEKDPKGGYGKPIPTNKKELIRHGMKQMKEEISLWKSEVREAFVGDMFIRGAPGVVDKEFQFRNELDLKKWIVTSDKDNDEGESVCQLTMSKNQKGLFSGNLCLDVPTDGVIKRTGYCNMRSVRAKRSFQRDSYYEWGMYTHLVFRVRGDGRSYALHLSTSSYFDMTWNDIYTYVLFTRGGPYWQYSRVPFSKFFFTSKGRIQDSQSPIPLTHVSSLGITLAERVPGPFALEIDYIGLETDPSHTEEFAYEMYRVPSGITDV